MRSVKILVTAMSLMIVICLGLFAYGLSSPNAFKKHADMPDNIALPLPSSAKIQNISLSGKTLAIHARDNSGAFIDLYDIPSQKIIRHIRIEQK